MKAGTIAIDKVERGYVYYNARITLFGVHASFLIPVEIASMDDKFIFLSVERPRTFQNQIREALDYNLIKQVY